MSETKEAVQEEAFKAEVIPVKKPVKKRKPKVGMVHKYEHKYSDEIVSKLEEAFSWGCSINEVCLWANISKTTYYEWIKNGTLSQDQVNRFETLKDKPILKARMTVINSLHETKDAQWYLERKRKKEFSQRVENTGADGAPVQVKWVSPE